MTFYWTTVMFATAAKAFLVIPKSKVLRYAGFTTVISICSNHCAAKSVSMDGYNEAIIQQSLIKLPSKYTSTLIHDTDTYDGVIIKEQSLPDSKEEFMNHLQYSLHSWKNDNKKGVWLKIPTNKLEFASIAVAAGFVMHHAEKDYLMLTKWLSSDQNKLPANASHQVGVGCVVVNNDGKLLCVQEKNGPLRGLGVWKVPTGLLDAQENIDEAACREVLEETGIHADFVGLLCFRHAHNFLFGKSDLFFVCLLKPKSDAITIQEDEIAACDWVDIDTYTNQKVFLISPLHSKMNAFIKGIVEDEKIRLKGSTTKFLELTKLSVGFRPGMNSLYLPKE